MHKMSIGSNRSGHYARFALSAGVAALVAGLSYGKTYHLNAGQNDGYGQSSLSGNGGTWTSEDGDAHQNPIAGNDYVAEGFTLLRTPEQSVNFVFPGNSLTLSSPDAVIEVADGAEIRYTRKQGFAIFFGSIGCR